MTTKAMDAQTDAHLPADLDTVPIPEIGRCPPNATVDEVLDPLERDGAVVIEDVLPAEDVDHKRAVAESMFDTTPMGRDQFEGYRTQRVYALFAKTRAFDDVALHPLILRLLDRTLGHYQLSSPMGLQLGAGEQEQLLHYDDQVYPVPWPRPHLQVKVALALCDFTEANGATRVVRGSHRWDRSIVPDPRETVGATMRAGSLLVYLGSLWHGEGANRTDQPRPTVRLEYAASWLRQQETQLLAVPPETVRDLSPRLQELLGYNIFPPFLGYVDGRHPRYLLDDD